MTQATGPADTAQADRDLLDRLTATSAEIEAIAASRAFRMDAAEAYAQIVEDRLAMLNEVSLSGRQTLREFMRRRYDPAIRTIRAARARQRTISDRAARLAQLLRTRVSVHMEEQNRDQLDAMNRRGALQLRLQETVEGLSVVAISYYAVSLLAYLLTPVGYMFVISKPVLVSVLTIPTVLGVWWFIRRMKHRLGNTGE